MAENVRNALFNNAVDLADEDGYIEEVDLTVQAWNRTTVADGQWLQDHAIGPLSARDLYLADKITDANTNIETLSANLAGLGIGGGSGSSAAGGLLAGKMKSFNAAIEDATYMSQKHINLVPTGVADNLLPSNTLQYLLAGNGAAGVDNDTKSYMQDKQTTLLQMNLDNAANQLMITRSGVFWRSYEDTSPLAENDWQYAKNVEPFKQLVSVNTSSTTALNTSTPYMLTWDNNKKLFAFSAYSAPADHFVTAADENLFTTANKSLGLKLTQQATQSDKLYLVGDHGYSAYTANTFTGGLSANGTTVSLDTPDTAGLFAFTKNGDNTITPSVISLPVFDGNSISADANGKYQVNAQKPIYVAPNGGLALYYDSNTLKVEENDSLTLNVKTSGGLSSDAGGVFVSPADFAVTGDEGSSAAFTISDSKLNANSGFILSGFSASAEYEKEDGTKKSIAGDSLQDLLNKLWEKICKLE